LAIGFVLVALCSRPSVAQQLTAAERARVDSAALADYAASLGPLGAPTDFLARGQSLRGWMTIRSYVFRAGDVLLNLTMMVLPDGRIEQYIVERAG
jgi:hypothetical protein